jgi:hypothetical protein
MAAPRSRRPDAAPRSSAVAAGARPPLVTLTTDFGTHDPFVGIMKGVILGRAPLARIVDVTHEVPPQAIAAGAHVLRSAAPWFPHGTIHVAVVDPGVGTRRRALVVETVDACFVGPDNGILSLAVEARAVRRIVDVSRARVRLTPVSRTFHGRDVFAPIAAALANGVRPVELGPSVRSMVRLRSREVRRSSGTIHGRVLWADHFGNLTTSIARRDLAAFRHRHLSITIGGHVVPFRSTYAGVPVGTSVALLNSADLLEIAVNGGSAAARLGVRIGAPVRVSRA